MNIIEVSGTAYEMGRQIGEYFRNYLQSHTEKYEAKLQNETVRTQIRQLEDKLKSQFPEGLEEIYGRADGAGIARDCALLMFFPEIMKKEDGCTTVIMKDRNGRFLISHNEDDVNYCTENTVLVRYCYEDYWVIGYTVAEKLTGSSFSFNSYGMLFTSNFIYDTKINYDNVSRYILIRSVIGAKTLDETVERLRKLHVASAFSFNIFDLKSHRAVNVEKDIEEIYLTEITDRYGRANHFTARKDDLLPEPPVSSAFRDQKARELLEELDTETVQIGDLKHILDYAEEDYNRCIFKDPQCFAEKSVTVSNLCYDENTGTITVTDYLGKTENTFYLTCE